MAIPSTDMLLRLKFKTNPTAVAYTGTAARNSTALTEGVYYIIASSLCYFLQGGSSVTATTSSHRLPADTLIGPIHVEGADASSKYISAIQDSAGGTLQIWKAES